MNANITKYVADWFARGDDDLALVELIREKGTGSPNLACFHAQQAAEKYLKGFLAHHELHVRKVHDVEALVEDCRKIDASFLDLQNDARFLNQFYIESRYPDDFVAFTPEDSEKAGGAGLRIKEFVLAKMRFHEGENGFGPLGILAIFVMLSVLVGGGYIAYERYRVVPPAPQESAKNSPPDLTHYTRPATPEDSAVSKDNLAPDTTSWKTYRNEKYGFEVKYPLDYLVRESEGKILFTAPGQPTENPTIVLEKVKDSLQSEVGKSFGFNAALMRWQNLNINNFRQSAIVISYRTSSLDEARRYLFPPEDYPRDIGDDGSRMMDIMRAEVFVGLTPDQMSHSATIDGYPGEIITDADKVLSTFKFIK